MTRLNQGKMKPLLNLVLLILSEDLFVYGLYPSKSEVMELNMDNFDQVYAMKEIWAVDFYAPWSEISQHFASEFLKFAHIAKGMTQAGAFNADSRHYFLKQMGITTIPVMKFYGITHDAIDYCGKRTVEALTGAVWVALQRKILYRQEVSQKSYKQIIVTLDDGNFDENVLMSEKTWLIEFYAPSCGRTRTFSPKFEKLCRKIKKDDIICGLVNTEQNSKTLDELKIKTHPVFLYFARGLKSKYSFDEYKGQLDPVDILDWVLTTYNETIPVPTFYQMVDEVTTRRACGGGSQLCVIVILPHIIKCNSSCRYSHLNLMFNIIRQFKTYPWGWMWFESGSQPFIETLFLSSEVVEPRIIVINYKKKEYMTTKKPFEETEIAGFLRRVSMDASVKREIKVPKIPRINTIPLWDGENAIIPAAVPITTTKDEL